VPTCSHSFRTIEYFCIVCICVLADMLLVGLKMFRAWTRTDCLRCAFPVELQWSAVPRVPWGMAGDAQAGQWRFGLHR
jgi:hypothetical protein